MQSKIRSAKFFNQINIFVIFAISRIFFYGVSLLIQKKYQLNWPYMFCQWDCGWYTSISKNGYMRDVVSTGPAQGQANWAFFPLEPIAIRHISDIIGIGPIPTAFICGNLFLLGGLLFLGSYLRKNFSQKAFYLTIIFIAISPVNTYFTSFYTESLFFFLQSAVVYYANKRNWLVAGIFGCCLSATRFVGIMVVPFLIYIYFKQKPVKNINHEKFKFIIALLLIPLGLLKFMRFLYTITGDAFAFYHIENAWGHPQNTFRWIYGSLFHASLAYRVYFLILILSLVGSFILFRKKMYGEFLLLFPVLVTAFLSQKIEYRFSLGSYPLYLLCAVLLEKKVKLQYLVFLTELFVLVYALKNWITGQGPT